MNYKWTVDVLIPTLNPGKKFSRLLQMLGRQTYPIDHIIIMNTEESNWNQEGYKDIPNLRVFHVTQSEFDHGATRDRGMGHSDADICICMTQDAVPADNFLVEKLVEALQQEGPRETVVASAYARQLPEPDCRFLETYTRSFNYPEQSLVKTKANLPQLGIKTYFCSNVCAAYRTDIYRQLGGFIKKTIFNEDMIYAASVIQAGYGIAYAADARVIHSHNYTAIQQMHRNFDLAVSQADHPEVFEGLPSEGEGVRLVRKSAAHLIKSGRFWLLPDLIWKSGFKYLGYLLGKRYQRLPKTWILALTMNPNYWTTL